MIAARPYAYFMVGCVAMTMLSTSAFGQDMVAALNEVTTQDLAKVQGQITQLKKALNKQSTTQQEKTTALKLQLASTDQNVSSLKVGLNDVKKNTSVALEHFEERVNFRILLLAGIFACFFVGQWLFKELQHSLSIAKLQTSTAPTTSSVNNRGSSYPQDIGTLKQDLPPVISDKLDAAIETAKISHEVDSDGSLSILITQELNQTQRAFDVARKSFMSPPDVS